MREIYRELTNKYEGYNVLSLSQYQLDFQQWVTSSLFIAKWREEAKREKVGFLVHCQNRFAGQSLGRQMQAHQFSVKSQIMGRSTKRSTENDIPTLC